MPDIYEYRGVEGLVYAPVTKDDGDVYETGNVKELAGVARIGKKVATSSDTHYYDNIPAVVINSVGADTITCDVSAIPLENLGDITGQDYDKETGALIEGEAKPGYFAIGYITKKTNGTEVYVWRYKGKFSIPDSEHETEDNGTAANGQQLVYTGVSTAYKFKKNGKRAKGIVVELEKDLADVTDFFESVTTPDTLKKKGA